MDHPSTNAARAWRWQLPVSLLLFLHVSAVVVGPSAVAPSSLLEQTTWLCFRPYLEAAYLNHGYRFFAPDPGPSHLVKYELQMPDGSKQEGVFPHLPSQRPRLLYHRHMMLAERLAGPPDVLQQDRMKFAFARSYAEHLQKTTGAESVTLLYVMHRLPSPLQVRQGVRLDDANSYVPFWKLNYPEGTVEVLQQAPPDYSGATP